MFKYILANHIFNILPNGCKQTFENLIAGIKYHI